MKFLIYIFAMCLLALLALAISITLPEPESNAFSFLKRRRPLRWLRDLFDRFPRPFDRALAGRHNLRGAEVGVWKGRHARALLNHTPVALLYLVDPYVPYDEVCDAGYLEAVHRKAVARCSDPRVIWLLRHSLATQLGDLDFVYLDADHGYDAVRADLLHWWPAINPGGLLGGHDFTARHDGVRRAVREFAARHSLKLHIHAPDWWVEKPMRKP